ncbi:unnamed protein product [Pocillopora meandrina]|uniref:Uncharacterized protein n=1 Tax=Pocillopora meandrina TaxID=46732 RepID=A0AAU9VV39_9CNID|nr:unnamed protein product [Pocillopora meandrina]
MTTHAPVNGLVPGTISENNDHLIRKVELDTDSKRDLRAENCTQKLGVTGFRRHQ